MINKWSFYTSLTIIIAFLSLGFKPFDLDTNQWFLTNNTDGTHYLFPSQKQMNILIWVFLIQETPSLEHHPTGVISRAGPGA